MEMGLAELLSMYNQEERNFLFKIGLISSNGVIIDYLQAKGEPVKMTFQDLFLVCREGTPRTFEYMKPVVDFPNLADSETGNTCAHIAGEYGNLQALEYLKRIGYDFGRVNNQHETALSYSIKNSRRLFESTIAFLGKETPVGIRDSEGNFVHQI